MIKTLLATVTLLISLPVCAGLELNQASAAELDSVRGIGPGTSGKILLERERGPYQSWADLLARVKGIGATRAAAFSAQGLTVNGAAFHRMDAANAPHRP